MVHLVKRGRWAQRVRLARLVPPATKAIPALQARRALKAWSVRLAPPARPGMMVWSDPQARLATQVNAAQQALPARQVRKV
jgi:hypothetical protein